MCIAVPTRILEIIPGPLPMARLQHEDKEVQCCLAYVPEASAGDYVLVQHGFAIELLDPESAAASLSALEELKAVNSANPTASR